MNGGSGQAAEKEMPLMLDAVDQVITAARTVRTLADAVTGQEPATETPETQAVGTFEDRMKDGATRLRNTSGNIRSDVERIGKALSEIGGL